jgi:hypothetical protein
VAPVKVDLLLSMDKIEEHGIFSGRTLIGPGPLLSGVSIL